MTVLTVAGRAAQTLPEGRFAAVVELLDADDLERRESAERILVEFAPEETLALAQELAAAEGDTLQGAHRRWRLLELERRIRDNAARVDEEDEESDGAGFDNGAAANAARPARSDNQVVVKLMELEASRRYSTDSPSFLEIVEMGAAAIEEMLAAARNPDLSQTLRYYALLAFQRVADPEQAGLQLTSLLAECPDDMVANVGSTFRQLKAAPDAVIDLAKSPNPRLRRRAILALGSMVYSTFGEEAGLREQVLNALLVLAEDPIHDVAASALSALRSFGMQGAIDERVYESAKSEDVELAAAAFECLRFSRGARVLAIAIEALERPADPVICVHAVGILAASARTQAREYMDLNCEALLARACESEVIGVRVAAWDAMGSMGSAAVSEAMVLKMRDRLARRVELELDPQEVSALARGLGNMGDEHSIEAFLAMLESESEDESEVTFNMEKNAALSALRSLSYKATPEAKERITQAFLKLLESTDRTVRFQAAQHVANLGEEAMLDALAPLIQDGDSSVRSVTINGLSRMRGSERAAAIVALALETDPESSLRSSAASVLTSMQVKSEVVVRALRIAAGDPVERVRKDAMAAMASLGIEYEIDGELDTDERER